MTQPLSPAAQAVLDATGAQGTPLELPARGIAAVALRAAADQDGIKPEPVGPMSDASPQQVAIALEVKRSQVRAHRRLLALAAELEATNS